MQSPHTHARCSGASPTGAGISAALKRCPPTGWTPSPLPPQRAPLGHPLGPALAGNSEAPRGGTDFPRSRTRFETGPDSGAGDASPEASRQREEPGEGEGSPRQGLGCYDGAEPWEGGIPSNPSHPSLPRPPGNLNPGFSRAASTGVSGYQKRLRSPVPQTTATEIIVTTMSLKSCQLKPSLGSGV